MMTQTDAVAHVEKILTRYGRIRNDQSRNLLLTVHVELWNVESVRVAEVDTAWVMKENPDGLPRGGACFMQSDLPDGLAACAAVERWILSLVMGDRWMIRESRLDVLTLFRGDVDD